MARKINFDPFLVEEKVLAPDQGTESQSKNRPLLGLERQITQGGALVARVIQKGDKASSI